LGLRRARRRRMALAGLVSLGAIGCGLSVSGTAPDFDDAAPSAMTDPDGSDGSSSGGSSSGGTFFDATLVSSSSGGPIADGGRAIADSSRDAGKDGSNDAADGNNPCQSLYACCANLAETAFAGSMVQGCLQAVQDGGATGCNSYLALFKSFALCP
jgi:hypothetical protein